VRKTLIKMVGSWFKIRVSSFAFGRLMNASLLARLDVVRDNAFSKKRLRFWRLSAVVWFLDS
jgi:hypothetical protein